MGHWDKTTQAGSDDSVPFTAANGDTSTTALHINSSGAVSEIWAREDPILYNFLFCTRSDVQNIECRMKPFTTNEGVFLRGGIFLCLDPKMSF